jgi:acyl-CoA reductase-like NAD-dependent aldehyde dehydrogenase
MSSLFSSLIPGATIRGKPLVVVSPYDGTEIATCETADFAAADVALKIAHSLYLNRDRWIPLPERLSILEQAMAIIRSRAEELALEAAREGGKPLLDSRVEVTRAIDSLRVCVETMRADSGREISMSLNAASQHHLAMTHRGPIGVVLAISAFNHPVNLIAHQVGPAVAAGCPVIVKPAEDTPLSCLRFVQILREAGLPPEWCIPVIAENLSVAEQLAVDPRIAYLTFIGSAKVGWMLRSKLAPGARCALEHGGVAPVIVAEDANVDEALPPIAKGGFYHAGQVCVSVQRVFVHERIAQEFARRLAQRAKQMKIGDPMLPETEIGPLIRRPEVTRVHEWVQEAVKEGAELLCGGRPIGATCYEATVLFNPPANVRVSREEIFGPVVAVYPYHNLDDAIARANELPFAFQAAVFTQDLDTAMRCYARLDASAVMVNEHTAFRVDWMPFAGLKHSGLGTGGIPYSIRDMQIEKMLVIKSKEL